MSDGPSWELKLTYDGVDEMIRKMGMAREKAASALAHRIFELSQENVADSSVDTGELLNSGYIMQMAPAHYRFGYKAFWASYREFGTRPHHPPVDALIPWCRRHLKRTSPNRVIEVPAMTAKVLKGKAKGMGKVMGAVVRLSPYGREIGQIKKGLREFKKMRRNMGVMGRGLKTLMKGRKPKGDKQEKEARRFAWALAKAINERGTEPAPFLRPAFQVGQLEFVKVVKEKIASETKAGA